MTPEEFLKENAKQDDWSNLEESIKDSLWTNNVHEYMKSYGELKERESLLKLKEVEEELVNLKTELHAYKMLKAVNHYKFIKILGVIQEQVSVEEAEKLVK